MTSSMSAVADLANKYSDVVFVLPMHENPVVREVVEPIPGGFYNVHLTEPLDYAEFARLMSDSYSTLTDSGGVQEEAPSLGKPVLVMREDTERPEGVEAGTARLVGTEREVVFSETSALLEDAAHYARMSNAVNPYGDGHAAERSAAAVSELLGLGTRLPDSAPE